jgi:hypothetical protein
MCISGDSTMQRGRFARQFGYYDPSLMRVFRWVVGSSAANPGGAAPTYLGLRGKEATGAQTSSNIDRRPHSYS